MQQLQNSSFRINFIAKIYHSIEMAFLQPLHSPVHNILSLLSKGIAVMMVLALPGDKKGLPFNNCPTKKWMGTQCPNIPQWMWWSWKSSLGHGCMAGVRERQSVWSWVGAGGWWGEEWEPTGSEYFYNMWVLRHLCTFPSPLFTTINISFSQQRPSLTINSHNFVRNLFLPTTSRKETRHPRGQDKKVSKN